MKLRWAIRTVATTIVLALAVCVGSGPATAWFGGSSAECEPNPGRSLVVVTVPRVHDFVFQVGERRYRTDSSGTVRIEPVTCLDGDSAITPVTDTVDQGGGKSAQFDTWYFADLLGRQHGDGTVFAAFRKQVRVSLKLVDLADEPVARDAVGTIVIKSSAGEEVEVPPGESSTTLDTSRVVRFSNRIVRKDVLWSVQSVDVQGNTAVNRGQVRFKPRWTRTVTVPLMLFELRVAVRDVLLHRTLGEQVVVSSPDGSEQTISLDSDGRGKIAALPRGRFVLKARGSSIAMAFEQPVSVSRPQGAELRVISHADITIAAGAFFSVVVGLLLVGRRLRIRSSGTKRAAARSALEQQVPVPVGHDVSRGQERATR